ncbi:hypothetical protein [Natronococcus sp. A-GB7]|uniref:hypothetical protein n=1 Tax=Natronococcus sp. A-GB7 TaxID=3037649 RepID=UPI00241D7696|nr:hypothetical protein [Natronococcus sp. A-GB7]MDG5819665.1 hypothetical protein [Natronococcus sp. A-GB7]
MAIERPLQVLNLYDVLTDLIPGAAFLLFIAILFPVETLPIFEASGAMILITVIGSLILGHMIQWVRGWECLWKQPDVFQHTMRQIRLESDLSAPRRDNNPNNTENSLPMSTVRYQFLTLVDEIFELDNTVSDTERYQIVLSFLETRPPVRALRFQSLYSFYRSMVVTSWAILTIGVVAIGSFLLGWIPTRPLPVLISVVLLGLILAVVTRERRDRFEKTFVGYAIREFYSEQKINEN